jgi:hypothetical protein
MDARRRHDQGGKYNEDEDMDRDANFPCSSANSTFRTRMFPFMR